MILLVNLRMNRFEYHLFYGIVDYYTKCKDFFLSEDAHTYHFACPAKNDTKEWEIIICSWEKKMSTYSEQGKTITQEYEKISKAYEFPYDGDIKKFLQGKWCKEKERILNFIDETLDIINIELNNRSKVNISKPRF